MESEREKRGIMKQHMQELGQRNQLHERSIEAAEKALAAKV